MREQRRLSRERQIMEHIEKSDVAGENRHRFLHVLKAKLDIFVRCRGDVASLPDFPRIDIEPEDRLPAPAFAQIKREQTNAASDIQDRLLRAAKTVRRRRDKRDRAAACSRT